MRASNRKAFTLVEIMIAAVLASLITLSAVAAVRIVTRGREKVEKYSDVNSELRYIGESMKKDLRNIYRSTDGRKFVGEILSTESGHVPSLTFYTTRNSNVRRGQPEGDICEVQYTVGMHNGSNVLLRRLWPNPSEELEPSGVVTVLSDNIVGFDIKYLDDKEWRSDWPADMGKDCEIMLVSIVAQLPGESQRVARSFMVDFPRRLAMTTTPSTAEVAATGAAGTGGTSGAGGMTGGASGGVSTSQGGVSNVVPGGGRGSSGAAQGGGTGRRRGGGTNDGSGRGRGSGQRGEGGMPPDGQGGPPPGPPPNGQGEPPYGPPPDGQGGPSGGGQGGPPGGGQQRQAPGSGEGGGAQE